MRALAEGIATDEALAGHLETIADAARGAGQDGVANGLRPVVRNHRIRAMEMRGQLAALRDRYSESGAIG